MQDFQNRRVQVEALSDEIYELGERYGISVYYVGLADDRWLEVKGDEKDFFMARGIFNLYAKIYDVPIFWYLGEQYVFQ